MFKVMEMSGLDEAGEEKNGLATKIQVINLFRQELFQRREKRHNSLNIQLKYQCTHWHIWHSICCMGLAGQQEPSLCYRICDPKGTTKFSITFPTGQLTN